MDLLEALLILESKQDQQKFIDKFGEEKWERFDSLKSRLSNKDLYYWVGQTEETLDNALLDAENKETNKKKRSSAKDGAILLAQDENWKCYKITTHKAATYYGRDTQWCVSSVDNTYAVDENGEDIEREPDYHFNKYTEGGEYLLFFIAKRANEECFDDEEWRKVAFSSQQECFYSSEDEECDLDMLPDSLQEFIEDNKQILKKIQ